MKIRFIALILCLLLLLSGCGKENIENQDTPNLETQGTTADLGDDDSKRSTDKNVRTPFHISYLQGIINYLATDKAFRNTQKSEWHYGVILKIQTIK